MPYTDAQLAITCPLCHAAKGVRCLDPVRDGSKFIDDPHPERVQAAEENHI